MEEQIKLYFYLYKPTKAWMLKFSFHSNNFGRLLQNFFVFCFFFSTFLNPSLNSSFTWFYDDGTLKWKSHDKTNAKTMQASRKFRNRWPCQKLRDSDTGTCAKTVVAAVALFVSFECSVDSMSFDAKTLCATEWHISQVLEQKTKRTEINIEVMKLKDEIIENFNKVKGPVLENSM